jgi:hypothetical protein
MQSSSSNGPIFVDPMSFNFTSDRFTAAASAPCILALSFLRFFANFTVPFSKSTTKRGVAPLVFLVVVVVVSNCSDDAFSSSTSPFVVIASVVASSPPPPSSAFVAIFLPRLPPRSVKRAFFFLIVSPYLLFPEEDEDEDEEELHEGATKCRDGAAECEEEANAKKLMCLNRESRFARDIYREIKTKRDALLKCRERKRCAFYLLFLSCEESDLFPTFRLRVMGKKLKL